MDKSDRDAITSNLVELVEQTNLDTLLTQLIHRGVFTTTMAEKYKENTSLVSERKRDMYLDLQRRGPNAFQNLLRSLLDTGHHDLVRRLKPDLDVRQYFLHHTTPVPQPNLPGMNNHHPWLQNLGLEHTPRSVVSLGTTPLEVVVTKATERRDLCTPEGLQVYPMITKPRGLFLMINNVQYINNIEKERIGAEVDERNLKKLFEEFGFIVESHQDEGLADMQRKITEFARREDHRRYDCCVVAIMSHGRSGSCSQDSIITAVDGQPLRVEWILNQFSSLNAERLVRKPKIFFFQSCRYIKISALIVARSPVTCNVCCRGDTEDFGVQMTTGRVQQDGHSPFVVPTMSDTLIGYSTLPGFKSNRDVHLGTWYIQAICEVFMKHAHALDIEDMLKMVNQKMESLQTEHRTLQTSTYENRGFRKLYFNPGLYSDGTESGFPLR